MRAFIQTRHGLRCVLGLLALFTLLTPLIPKTVLAENAYVLHLTAANVQRIAATTGPNSPIALPVQSVEADRASRSYGTDGVNGGKTPISQGVTLNPTDDVCNDFTYNSDWAATAQFKPDTSTVHHYHSGNNGAEALVLRPRSDIATDWYAGWAPFAVDDGGRYHANSVVFAREHVVGPGSHYGHTENFSVKIASMQPYAAGFGSPLISVKAGSTVTVTVNYLIFNHDNGAKAYDWASLGIKPEAREPAAEYVNGYVRGQWATLSHTIKIAHNGRMMVLLQASSPMAVNSNVYFDNVKLEVNGVYKPSCTHDVTGDKKAAATPGK